MNESVPKKKKIVVTDDDPGIQDIFRMILERAGFDIQMISDGHEILNNNFQLPDLFILDKQLSGLDGLDICKFLKAQPSTAHVPVIMVSANPRIAVLSKEAGADNYIEKPFDIKHFLAVIRDHLPAD
ncbi:MAG: response regulator [Chitinophagaceae bacterium]|nr:response regulator [Chitinophagaceae bacterium]